MTGMLPDCGKMMDACFNVLAEFDDEGGISKSDIYMLMDFIPGGTLKKLDRGTAHPGLEGASQPETGYDISSLSDAVPF